MRRTAIPQRRGISMMLVLISLGMGTILATSFLASRDNSVAIGDNVASAAAAKAAAAAGIELGVAILETASEWRIDHVNGKLVDDLVFGDVEIDIDLVDMETQQPPTAETTIVQMRCTCTVNGIVQTATAVASVPTEESMTSLGVDLSEFAVFTSGGINMSNDATVTRWNAAPATTARKRVAVGSLAKTAGQISLLNNAAMIDTTIYTGPGASGSLITNGSGVEVEQKVMLDDIPLPAAPSVPVASPSGGHADMNNVMTLSISADMRVDRLETAANQGLVRIADGVTLVVEDRLRLNENSGIVVQGDATIIVFNEFEMRDQSSIQLASTDGSLTLYVVGSMDLENAYIGNKSGTKPDRDSSGNASWMDPNSIQIFGSSSSDTWYIEETSVVKGSIYAPAASIYIEDSSAVYGRIASQSLSICTNGAVFYDHSLNTGNGFTNPNSMVYESDGRIKTAVKNLTSLNQSALETLGEEVGGTIRTVTGILVGSDTGGTVVTTTPGQPTPRTIPVEFGLISSGSNVFAMESAVSSGGWAAVKEVINEDFDVLPATKTAVVNERLQVSQ